MAPSNSYSRVPFGCGKHKSHWCIPPPSFEGFPNPDSFGGNLQNVPDMHDAIASEANVQDVSSRPLWPCDKPQKQRVRYNLPPALRFPGDGSVLAPALEAWYAVGRWPWPGWNASQGLGSGHKVKSRVQTARKPKFTAKVCILFKRTPTTSTDSCRLSALSTCTSPFVVVEIKQPLFVCSRWNRCPFTLPCNSPATN